jgi:hypothetical protein
MPKEKILVLEMCDRCGGVVDPDLESGSLCYTCALELQNHELRERVLVLEGFVEAVGKAANIII